MDRARARVWSLQEMVPQWQKLFAAPPQRWLDGQSSEVERVAAEAIID